MLLQFAEQNKFPSIPPLNLDNVITEISPNRAVFFSPLRVIMGTREYINSETIDVRNVQFLFWLFLRFSVNTYNRPTNTHFLGVLFLARSASFLLLPRRRRRRRRHRKYPLLLSVTYYHDECPISQFGVVIPVTHSSGRHPFTCDFESSARMHRKA